MVKLKNGILITFEGTEGSGKSTLIRSLCVALKRFDIPVVQTREPGGSQVAEKIRSLVLNEEMDSRTELFLYEAARSVHWTTVIQPALSRGAIVLCDRFTDSTLAYQAFARGLPWKEVKQLNRMATSGGKPHLTILLDIDPETGLRRAQDPNRFEAAGVQFQKKVRSGYLKARSEDPKRWLTLKVDKKSPEKLTLSVLEYLKRRFTKQFSQIPSSSSLKSAVLEIYEN
jgi:dTMP kinase